MYLLSQYCRSIRNQDLKSCAASDKLLCTHHLTEGSAAMLSGMIALIIAIAGFVATVLTLLSEELNKNKKLKYAIVTILSALALYAMLGSILSIDSSSEASSKEQQLQETIWSFSTTVAANQITRTEMPAVTANTNPTSFQQGTQQVSTPSSVSTQAANTDSNEQPFATTSLITPIADSSAQSLPTVEVGAENSIIELTTGLGVQRRMHSFDVTSEDNILQSILWNLSFDTKKEHIIIGIGEGAYILMPLQSFQQATMQSNGRQLITLQDGTTMEGLLDSILKDDNGQSYDLKTANSVKLLALSGSEESSVNTSQIDSPSWQLEIFAPISQAHIVNKPRFVFEYSTYELTGYRDHESTTETFYIKDNSSIERLGNINDFDSIEFLATDNGLGTDQIAVTVGGVQSQGSISVVNTVINERGWEWYLLANLEDSDLLIALHNYEKPAMKLRKK
jgi:type II secretory pathway pseudopilin PulG